MVDEPLDSFHYLSVNVRLLSLLVLSMATTIFVSDYLHAMVGNVCAGANFIDPTTGGLSALSFRHRVRTCH